MVDILVDCMFFYLKIDEALLRRYRYSSCPIANEKVLVHNVHVLPSVRPLAFHDVLLCEAALVNVDYLEIHVICMLQACKYVCSLFHHLMLLGPRHPFVPTDDLLLDSMLFVQPSK